MNAAKRTAEITSASLKQDKLFVNGRQYTVDNISTLPECLQPHNVATAKNEDVIVFFTKNAIFSNFHPLEVSVNGNSYCCNEQYIQHSKACLFGDNETANAIMETNDPVTQKALGKKVKGFNKETWLNQVDRILETVNHAKYVQHPNALKALKDTGQRVIGEASLDQDFGIGMGLNHKNACNSDEWQGHNRMGKTLAHLRDTVFKDKSSESDD